MKTVFVIATILLSVVYINATNDLADEHITTWGNVQGNATELIHIESTMRQEFFVYPTVSLAFTPI